MISDTYISQIEGGNFSMSLPALLTVINTLGITCEEFFFDDYQNYEQDKELLDVIKALPPERKAAFLDLMKNTK